MIYSTVAKARNFPSHLLVQSNAGVDYLYSDLAIKCIRLSASDLGSTEFKHGK